MFTSRNTTLCFSMVLLGLAVTPATTTAAAVSFTGTFQQDDNVRLFGFTLSAPSTVVMETWSYGGGTNAQGQVVARGGFATVVSLFSGSGAFIDVSLTGSCPPQNLDPTTGLCGDSFLSDSLAAGNYLVAITEYANIPNGPSLGNGFLETGQGNFTGPIFCGAPGSFFDATCNQRGSNFELDILGVTSAVAVPEPAGLAMLGSTFLATATLFRRRLKSRASAQNLTIAA